MADEIESAEVLELIEHELAQARRNGLDPQHELFVAVRGAMAGNPDDPDGDAAAALGTLLAYGAVSRREGLDRTLSTLAALVNGLQGVNDVHYLGTSTFEHREISLREHLSDAAEPNLTLEERRELERFVATVFERKAQGPDDEPDPQGGGPRP